MAKQKIKVGDREREVFNKKAMVGRVVHFWKVKGKGIDPLAAIICKSHSNGIVSLQVMRADSGGPQFIPTAYHITDPSIYGPTGNFTEKAKCGVWDFFDESEECMEEPERGRAFDPDLDVQPQLTEAK